MLAVLALLAGCIAAPTEPVRHYRLGIAKIGETYHVFVPQCPGEKVADLQAGDEQTWWRAAGPRSVTGPGEFLTLGVDDPFAEVVVRAGSNPALPTPPARLSVRAFFVGLNGETKSLIEKFDTGAVPAQPAGTDPQTARYAVRGDDEPVTADEIRRSAGCPLGSSPGTGPVPGQQPASAIAKDAADRVKRSLLDPAGVAGLGPWTLYSPYTEDVASHVCRNSTAMGAVSSAYGQQRTWHDKTRSAEQFAGAFGAIPAADAVAQVDAALTCTGYDYLYAYRDIRRMPLPRLPRVDRQLMFCALRDGSAHVCTVLLARGDMLTRLLTVGKTRQAAVGLAEEIAPQAADRLAAGTA
ncbi:hypothetical protein ACTOB_000843 [Actinoplanes oblitus]|uniref:Uncharacterized protein n=1 Tax=Actinoplanes oblitus TaxID=3040509 RepID=A0ABY8WNH5_9ACTN|nr:hypothetical protein [Actinoplanes oblitus]WIM97335.1 hypothetical protein ACTOB_000843 [Actinoplanes oblitus]